MKAKATNKVSIVGSILSTQPFASGQGVSVRLITDGSGTKSLPTVLFFQPALLEGLKPGDQVSIEAHIQEKIKKGEDGEKTQYFQNIVGDNIIKTPRILANYFEGEELMNQNGGRSPDKNVVLLCGKVNRSYSPSDNTTLLTLFIQGKVRGNYCEATCFARQAQFARSLQNGDNVILMGTIQTNVKREDGKLRRYQCVGVVDIEKIDEIEVE